MTEEIATILPPSGGEVASSLREEAASLSLLTQAPQEPLASFTGVWRYWGRGTKRWAVLRDVDLTILPGTITGIGGRNGAGKTTLLRIATGILAPNKGTVRIDGIRARDNWREYHRRIGFLAAGDRGLFPRLTVRGHMDYWAKLAFVRRGERESAVEDALVHFGLSDLVTRRADRLSQGQRQRLRLALTFVHQPKLILLDEPRNSLDADGLGMLAQGIRERVNTGGAVVWCSPLGEDPPIDFNRMLVIEDGNLRRA